MSRPEMPEVSAIDYTDLEIEVGRCLCGEGEVRILGSPFDRPRERFELSYDADELNQRLEELDELQLATSREEAAKRKQLAEKIGQDLYRALLPGKVRQTFGNCLAALRTLQASGNAGLRIRLSFGEASRYLPEVVGLPWELLCSPETLEFPSAAPESPLVRYLDLEKPVEPVTVTPPLRVLAIVASPRGLPQIDRQQHQRILKGAENPRLELSFFQPPMFENLRGELGRRRDDGKPIHAVHFFGHGHFGDDGEGYLYFERPDGGYQEVSGRELARSLGGFREVRLAVLSTCVGARMLRRKGQHPFAGTASALVAGGLPAVVGMQFPVSESAASEFTRSFYHHLAKGRSLEEAVTEGRLRILGTDPGTFEWASPVLFLRARDGRVLDLVDSGTFGGKDLSSGGFRGDRAGRDFYKAYVMQVAGENTYYAEGNMSFGPRGGE